jgi:ubiquinone/menaquinone biosynthesis C-methylase UbiE
LNGARFARAFGGAAEEYERGRPGYSAAAIEALVEAFELGPRSVVVDLAAGTGKLTRDLAARFERVIAIEPLAEMRAQLERAVPGAVALEGTAERMPVDADAVDAVFVAQAFHWFDGRRALEEIARVLRPRGGLGVLVNTTPWEVRETPWFAAIDDVLERSRADLSALRRNATGRWLEAFDRHPRFEPLADAVFDNTVRLSVEDFLAGFASRSYVATLAPEDRAGLLAKVRGLLDRDDAPLEAGLVAAPMRTGAFWTRLTASD